MPERREYVDLPGIKMVRSRIHRATWISWLVYGDGRASVLIAGPFATVQRAVEKHLRDENEYIDDIGWTRFGPDMQAPSAHYRDA